MEVGNGTMDHTMSAEERLPQAVVNAMWRRFGSEAGDLIPKLQYSGLMDCWMFPWAGMTMGVERDGYIHS